MTKTAMKTFEKVVNRTTFSGIFKTDDNKKMVFDSYMAFLVDDFETNLIGGISNYQIDDSKQVLFNKFEIAKKNNRRIAIPSDKELREFKKENSKTPFYRVGETAGFDIRYYFWIESVLGSKMEVYVNNDDREPMYFKSAKGEAILMPVSMEYDDDWE